MPGRFVIDRDGTILYAEVNPDYTRRPEPEDMLPALRRAAAIKAQSKTQRRFGNAASDDRLVVIRGCAALCVRGTHFYAPRAINRERPRREPAPARYQEAFCPIMRGHG